MQIKPNTILLTIVIQTKNEANYIEDCIKSCKGLAQELLVVDMRSTDSTKKIAKKLGARVVSLPDLGYVEQARQKAISLAKGDWILMLDADERLTPSLKKTLKKYLKKPTASVAQLPRKNLFFSTWLRHGLFWPDYQIRLFKKNKVHWPKKIHAKPTFSTPLHTFPATQKDAITHLHTVNFEDRIKKIMQQAKSESFYSELENISPDVLFDRIEQEFPRRFFQELGNKDGIHGYIAAKLMEYYRFIEFIHYWEKNQKSTSFRFEKFVQKLHTKKLAAQLLQENTQYRNSKIFWFYRLIKKCFSFIKNSA